MLRKVEIGARMDSFHFLEAERHTEFDVSGGIGVMGQLLMVVIAVFFIAETECLVPFKARRTPIVEILKFLAWTHKELHLHLLELTHTEYELTGHYLVAERLADLSDSERDAHTTCLLHIQIIDEDALCRLRTEIHIHGTVGGGSHLRLEHQVELAHVCPILCA